MGNDDTKNIILNSAKKEFLAKGYEGASLRKIAAMAGLTTGAIYGYFKDKLEMFSALVEDATASLYQLFDKTQNNFFKQEVQWQAENMASPGFMEALIDLIYSHFDEFKLIICHSKGTQYACFLNRLSEYEEAGTYRFIENLKKEGRLGYEPSDELIHILCSASVKSIFEIVEHDLPKEKALDYGRKIYAFYESGWKNLLFRFEN